MKDKLLIIGASGHGKVVADIAIKMNRWNEIYFLDDNKNIKSSMGIKVIGKSEDVYNYINEFDIFIAIGNNLIREKIYKTFKQLDVSIPTLIHPNAIIGSDVEIGAGTVIMAGAVINCCTKIGKGCIINTGATVDHDNVIGDYVHISPGANLAGSVGIGRGSWIGTGSVISNNVRICGDCMIGAGAVAVKDIMESGTYVGIPVEKIR